MKIDYGCERFGRLTRAMVHRPDPEALEGITEENRERLLFDEVPDVPAFIEEFDRFRELLEAQGVEVLELADHVIRTREMARAMPNLAYLHDIAVVSSKGAILSTMTTGGRRDEQLVVKEALEDIGVPILIELDHVQDTFEGCLLLDEGCLIVMETERHSGASVDRFVALAGNHFDEVIKVDVLKARRYMHPDTLFNRVREDLALAYPAAFLRAWSVKGGEACEVDFVEHVRSKGYEIVPVSDAEQGRLACSFVPLQPGVVMHYDDALDPETVRGLEKKGVEFVMFHPDALHAGGGSLRCMTLRLHRQ